MQTNADMTLYVRSINETTRAEEWTRVQVRCITWQAMAGAKVLPNGVIKDDKALVFIPFDRAPLALQEGSVIVKGLVAEEITPEFTMTDLRKKYPDNVLTIRRVTPRDYGSKSMQHWEIGAS